MANKTRSTFAKRQKEVARQAKRNDKQARKRDAKQKKAEAGADPSAVETTEDPDIAGIGLGPQPLAFDLEDDEAGQA